VTFLAAHDHDVSGFGVVEWILVGLAVLLVVWVIWRAVVLTLNPGETDPEHIKRQILRDEPPPPGQKPHPSDDDTPARPEE